MVTYKQLRQIWDQVGPVKNKYGVKLTHSRLKNAKKEGRLLVGYEGLWIVSNDATEQFTITDYTL